MPTAAKPRGRRLHSTAKNYLCGVRHTHMSAGCKDPLADKPLVRRAIKGAKRMQVSVESGSVTECGTG